MSNINADIDATFPIAGQDNDSQGFRDNFYKVNSNFTTAKLEIDALEAITTMITVSPLTNVGADGDLAGQVAIADGYIYICSADYTTGGATIWHRVLIDATW